MLPPIQSKALNGETCSCCPQVLNEDAGVLVVRSHRCKSSLPRSSLHRHPSTQRANGTSDPGRLGRRPASMPPSITKSAPAPKALRGPGVFRGFAPGRVATAQPDARTLYGGREQQGAGTVVTDDAQPWMPRMNNPSRIWRHAAHCCALMNARCSKCAQASSQQGPCTRPRGRCTRRRTRCGRRVLSRGPYWRRKGTSKHLPHPRLPRDLASPPRQTPKTPLARLRWNRATSESSFGGHAPSFGGHARPRPFETAAKGQGRAPHPRTPGRPEATGPPGSLGQSKAQPLFPPKDSSPVPSDCTAEREQRKSLLGNCPGSKVRVPVRPTHHDRVRSEGKAKRLELNQTDTIHC